MTSHSRILVLLLLVIVVALFLAPTVDLEPTALRASRAAAMLFLAIFFAAHLTVGHGSSAPVLGRRHGPGWNEKLISCAPPSLVDLYCSRLC
ncbi:MAG TPA: hypothetical protein VGF06_01875 [Terriglobales bacterium]|jgi:hypothetical protein